MVTVPSIQMRRRLVAHLRRSGYVHERRVMEAFLTVPREVFLPEVLAKAGLTAVYRDEAIVTRRDETSHAPLSSSSQPAIMALMLEMLDVRPGHRVVEIGAGTGYNAAILAVLAGASGLVVSLDIDVPTANAAAAALRSVDSGVQVLVADGTQGLPGMAHDRRRRADRWMVTASTTAVPRGWHDQIAHGGRLVVPLRLTDEPDQLHAVSAFVKVDDGFDSIAVTPGGFMPLRCADGTAFDPTMGMARAPRPEPVVVADPEPESESAECGLAPATVPAEAGRPRRRGRGGGRSAARVRPQGPLRGADREEMEKVRIVVRYVGGKPSSRWVFDRGDHWIGVDPAR